MNQLMILLKGRENTYSMEDLTLKEKCFALSKLCKRSNMLHVSITLVTTMVLFAFWFAIYIIR